MYTGETDNQVELRFCKRHVHLKGKSPSLRVSPSLYQGEEDSSLSPETVIKGEGKDLNPHNKHTLPYCIMPDNIT